jgi:hypothetical protein
MTFVECGITTKDSVGKWGTVVKKLDMGQSITILANVGVIIGIVFLAIEVRHASNATRLQTIDSVSAGWFQLNDAVIRDPQVARAWTVGLYNPSALSNAEAAQFSMYMRMFQNQVLRVRMHHKLGLFPREEYEGALQQLAQLMSTPGGRLFREAEKDLFDATFARDLQPYIDQEPVIDLILGRDVAELE